MMESGLLEEVEAGSEFRSAFNPATLLVSREIDISRVLGWMLAPEGSHGAGAAYLSEFLTLCGLEGVTSPGLSRVRLEVPRKAGGNMVGRIDIEVTHASFTLLVENKPWAKFGASQLERYARTLPNDANHTGLVVALLGAGWSDQAAADVAARCSRALRLGCEVRDWVAACSLLPAEQRVRTFLTDFERYLDEHHGGGWSRSASRLTEAMTSSPGSVEAAVRIMDARDALTRTVGERFAAEVGRRARAAGLPDARPLPGESPLFGYRKHGIVRLGLGHPDLDFAVSAELGYFREVAVGVCTRREMRTLRRAFADEIDRLGNLLGQGEPDDGAWWLWWEHVHALDPSGERSADGPAIWGWAADLSDAGLAACVVARALDARRALNASDR